MSEHAGGVDPDRLARLLGGESDETERAQTLSEVAALPTDQLDVFADALRRICRDNEEQKRLTSLPDEQI
jgi:hypothetical protein